MNWTRTLVGVAVVLAMMPAVPALAVSLGDMAREAAQDFQGIPVLLEILFYIGGAVLVLLGLMLLRRHSTHPQQVTVASGFVAIGIGVALIFAPPLIDAISGSFGLDQSTPSLRAPTFRQ